MDNLRLICSLATWRTLKGQQKTPSDIIAIFCQDVIGHKYATLPFEVEELQQELQKVYGFELPNSVIDEILSKTLASILCKSGDKYKLTQEIQNAIDLSASIANYEKQYQNFSNDLLSFIKSKPINKSPKEALDLFNEYLLYENTDKTLDKEIFVHFGNFLLKNEQKYKELLQAIKEGCILYDGLTYNVSKTKNINKLILFLDTEIIFSARGYNGGLHKKKFDEFYRLVCKYDENRLLMPLYYDESIENEIEQFFYKAKQIKKQKNANYRLTPAMIHLMEHFQDEIEIETEQSNLFYELKRDFKIQKYGDNKMSGGEKQYEELLNEYKDFNLENLEVLNNIKQEIKNIEYFNYEHIDAVIDGSIRILNLINLIRNSYPTRFFEAKAFLITNTALTNAISWHKDIMSGKNIPLSTKLDFITARLWELLESSLGNKLETLSPIFKIQVLLKEILCDKLDKQYTKAQQDYKKDKDENKFVHEIIDILDKSKLEPNIENMPIYEIILSDKIEEERKIINIEKDKQHKLGIEQGEEIGIKKGIEIGIKQERERLAREQEHIAKEKKRKEKIDKLDRLKRNKCNKINRKIKKLWQKIKKYYKAIISSAFLLFILAFIGAFGGFPKIFEWIKSF